MMVYTLSKAINYADNDANPRIQWQPYADLNRGLAQYDHAYNFQTYWVLDSPFGKGQRWVVGGIGEKLLGGWQLNGILSAMSGLPVTILQNNAVNLNAGGSGQVPDQVKGEVAILGGVGPGKPWFDPTAFAPVNIPAGQPQRFGNAGRNNVRGPGLFNTDVGLFRTFDVAEKFKVQFRAEALNVFNHPNFALGLQWDGNTTCRICPSSGSSTIPSAVIWPAATRARGQANGSFASAYECSSKDNLKRCGLVQMGHTAVRNVCCPRYPTVSLR